jgi:hypothetical protein
LPVDGRRPGALLSSEELDLSRDSGGTSAAASGGSGQLWRHESRADAPSRFGRLVAF